MRFVIAACFILSLLCLAASYAYAGGAGADPSTGEALDYGAKVVGVALGALLTYLGHRAIKLFEKKTGLDIPEREEQLINGYIDDAVHLAEEQAHRLEKMVMAGKAQPPMSGEAKDDLAVDHAHRRAQAAGLEAWTRPRIKDKVAAKVNRVRTPKNGIARPSTIPPA